MKEEAFDFEEIRSFDDADVPSRLWPLADHPALADFVHGAFPDIDMAQLSGSLKQITTIRDFQHRVVAPLVLRLAQQTCASIRLDGADLIPSGHGVTFITNHRDIVLDSAFLNSLLAQSGKETAEIAIGDNLLAYDWIRDLVRLNKSFIVLRSVSGRELMAATRRLSAYIHHTVADRGRSVWIAQREGRSKDCSDRTQASVIKMLAMGGPSRDLLQNVRALHLQPVALSYEYDPCDYLKARELQLKRDDEAWRKTKQDDLLSMATGLRGRKGRVVFTVTPSLDAELDRLPATLTDRGEQATAVCAAVDRALHGGMHLFEINYVAYDLLHESDKYADRYTPEQRLEAIGYLNDRLAMIELPQRDEEFLWRCLLTQYAHPVINREALTERPVTPAIPLT